MRCAWAYGWRGLAAGPPGAFPVPTSAQNAPLSRPAAATAAATASVRDLGGAGENGALPIEAAALRHRVEGRVFVLIRKVGGATISRRARLPG